MGLCARFVLGVGCVGVVGVLEFRFSTCLSTYSLAGWGVGLSGCSGDGGCVSVRKEAFQDFISPT